MEREITIRFRLDDEDVKNLLEFMSLSGLADVNLSEFFSEPLVRAQVKEMITACMERERQLEELRCRGDNFGVPMNRYATMLVCMLAAKTFLLERKARFGQKAGAREDALPVR